MTTQNEPPDERELIARRAYEIYLARGGEKGYELEDWLQAEREIGAQHRPGSQEETAPILTEGWNVPRETTGLGEAGSKVFPDIHESETRED